MDHVPASGAVAVVERGPVPFVLDTGTTSRERVSRRCVQGEPSTLRGRSAARTVCFARLEEMLTGRPERQTLISWLLARPAVLSSSRPAVMAHAVRLDEMSTARA